jgi:hypothetical protein
MGIAGYVSVCVQLYCVGFHRTIKKTIRIKKENRKTTNGNMASVTK